VPAFVEEQGDGPRRPACCSRCGRRGRSSEGWCTAG
jgi:hypothetical protein